MAVKRVHEKRFNREMTDLDTLNVDGIVRTNVGYKSLSETAESRHFYINNTHLRYRLIAQRYWTIAHSRHHRLIAKQSIHDIH